MKYVIKIKWDYIGMAVYQPLEKKSGPELETITKLPNII